MAAAVLILLVVVNAFASGVLLVRVKRLERVVTRVADLQRRDVDTRELDEEI